MLHRILLIQEDAVDAGAIREALDASKDSNFKVEWVKRCSDAVERLAEVAGDGVADKPKISAIMLDLFLSDSRGVATFHEIHRRAPQIPILTLVSPEHEESAKLAVQHGAQDFLLKDRLDAHLLPKVLRGVIEQAANREELFVEKQRAQVTLNSVGDAVMCTDSRGNVTFLNVVAERLTGWAREDAAGRKMQEVLNILDADTRERVQDPILAAMREGKAGGVASNRILVRRDGLEAAIEDTATPIHDQHGQVTGAVMVFHDVSSARALAVRMAYLAQHDSLTDLPNRVLLTERLAHAMALAQRSGGKLGLLYLDIDRFKTINDSMGHAMGDRLLQSVAQRLLGCVRRADTVSRQGGDEFVVLLSQLSESQDAAVSAEKIIAALAAPHYIEQQSLYVTVSIGIVTFPDDGRDAETLLKSADLAMYRSKDNGRNCYHFYKSEMNSTAVHRQSIENGLRIAIERRAFILHYQPKFDLQSGRIVGMEALVRWRHPMRGIVLPSEFMAIAEESGLIVPLGRWILREACRQAALWRQVGLSTPNIAVNISAVELRAKDFVPSVRAVLEETGFDPNCLELELTETFLMQDAKSTTSVLRDLKSLGVRLGLDDFGTGYSSLSYMRRFPIDTLKIDESFVRDVATDSNNASIVRAVISMGKSLHMRVVAEGIETVEQLGFLQDHECPEGQGFYLARPVVAKHMARLLGMNSVFTGGRAWTRTDLYSN